ncbi:MAG TPA: cell wall hydrolase [Allosphingosinicella sp.]|nr:cell wall hydrolase [Allosphingosinicella sp.]
MSVFGKPFAVALGAVALSGTAMVPFAYALAGSSSEAQVAPQIAPQPTPVATPAVLAPPEAAVAPTADEEAPPAEAAPSPPAPPASQVVDAELTCLAKVVVHEAGNQSRQGQMAVAQVVMNRVNDPRRRFGRTICGVIMQRGQFFNVHAYNPSRTNARWRTAVEIARQARDGTHPPVIGNALFFHAAYAPPFRGRARVGRIGDHVFYR